MMVPIPINFKVMGGLVLALVLVSWFAYEQVKANGANVQLIEQLEQDVVHLNEWIEQAELQRVKDEAIAVARENKLREASQFYESKLSELNDISKGDLNVENYLNEPIPDSVYQWLLKDNNEN